MAETYGKSRIGKGTYIGENVVIGYPGKNELKFLINNENEKIAGSIIGEDSLVGAGAVVTKDVEPYTIAAGVPAKKIGIVPEVHRR